jgi:hypothetical protein
MQLTLSPREQAQILFTIAKRTIFLCIFFHPKIPDIFHAFV